MKISLPGIAYFGNGRRRGKQPEESRYHRECSDFETNNISVLTGSGGVLVNENTGMHEPEGFEGCVLKRWAGY